MTPGEPVRAARGGASAGGARSMGRVSGAGGLSSAMGAKGGIRGARGLLRALALAALAALATSAQAQTEVPSSWSLIPSGLNAGDSFRLLIVTSTQQSAPFTGISSYDTVVQNDVSSNGHADIRSHSGIFKTLGCTRTTDATTHTGTGSSDTAAPIYWLDGAKIADDYADLYDGSWDSNAPKYPSGTDAPTSGSASQVFVGCQTTGVKHASRYLGASLVIVGYPGNAGFEIAPDTLFVARTTTRRYYGLSGIFRVAPSGNRAPTVATVIPDQTTPPGVAFTYTFPDTTFADADTDDTLTYTAAQSDDSELPSWLSFDATTRTFSGTPTAADHGTLTVRVTASDANGGSVTDDFDITVNSVPTVAAAIPDQEATTGTAFTYTFLDTTFADADDGDTLTYTAARSDGSALPSWLTFNATTRTFSGTPQAGDDGTLTVRVTARDGNGGSVTDDFDIAVNNAPTVATVIPDQTTPPGTAFTYTFPATTFADDDAGDTLTYTAAQSDGSALPSWLSFNATTRTFSGTPQAAHVGTLTVRVTANDGNGGSVSDTFDITVNRAPTASNNTVTTGQNTGYTFAASDFNFTDADGDALAGVKITTLESAGFLRLSDVNVTLNQVITKADIDDGKLEFSPAAGASGDSYATFMFKVNDGTEDSASAYTMTIDVTAASFCAAPSAGTLVSNAAQTGDDNPTLKRAAQAFTTGAHSGGYTLADITLQGSFSVGIAGTVTLHSGSRTGTKVADFSVCAVDNNTLRLTPTTATTLSASTTYVIVTANDFLAIPDWTTTASDSEDGGGAAGWSIADGSELYRTSTNAWATITNARQFTVHGAEKDTTAPTFDSATVDGATLVITMSEDLAAAASLANTAFTVKKTPDGGTEATVALTGSPVISGKTVTLTLAAAVVFGDTAIKVSYTKPTSGSNNKLKDADDNETATFTDQPVTNSTNSVPTASSNTVTTGEDTPYTFAASDFNFTDADGDALAGVKITTLESAGFLRLSDVNVTLNQVITKADIDGGRLTFRPATGETGDPYATFMFKVNDGTADSASAYTMTIDVTPASFCQAPSAGTLVSNAAQAGEDTPPINRSAQAFTTGAHSGGYTLTDITLEGEFGVGIAGTATLHSGSRTGTKVADFSVCAVDGNTLRLTPTTATTLSASTTYVIVTANDFGASQNWFTTTSDSEDGGGATGWSIADGSELYRTSTNTWATSSVSRKFTVHGAAKDTTAPTFASATVNGTSLVITMSETLAAAASLANTAFTVKRTRGGTEATVNLSGSPAISGKTVTLTLAAAVVSTDTAVKVSYTKPTSGENNKLKDADDNETASFTDQPVTNNTADTTAPDLRQRHGERHHRWSSP